MHPEPDERIYDGLDNYINATTDIGEAAVPLGMLLAWCTNMRLLSREFEEAHDRAVLRVRMHEVKGSELLVAAGGDLYASMFSEQGQKFLNRYYDEYLVDYRSVFDVQADSICSVQESWENYARLAEVLTARLLKPGRRQNGFFKKIRKRLWG